MAKNKKKAKKGSSNSVKKTAVTAGAVLVLGTTKLNASPQFLVGLYGNVSVPFGSLFTKSLNEKNQIPYGFGGTGRFIFRPYPVLDVFAETTYNQFFTPLNTLKMDSNGDTQMVPFNPSQLSFSAGAGYNIPLSERFSLNASMKAGVSLINDGNNMNPTMTVGASVGFTYKIHPVVSAGMNVSGEFNGPELIPVTASPGITININEIFNKQTNLHCEVVEQDPVFPVLYSWYENNPFGVVRIANLEDATIKNIKVSFYQPQYMNNPNLCAEMDELGVEEYFDADLTAFFNERMLELTELTDTQSIVSVEYTYLGQKRKKDFPVVIPVYDRNSMNWADDRRAASFVSSKDPAAMWFSKYVTSIVRDNVRSGVPQNIQYAMGIFETLDQFGINYVIDPSSAYADNIGGESVDFLQFPYQTLTYRGGDCDDLSILVCSLFEAVGIKSAFITVPGHIYMAFDTGLTEDEAYEKFADPSQVIFRDGKVWMPLEVTISDEGFMKAWRVGAREWNVADAQDAAAIFPMEDSWKIYRPVSVPSAEANFDMPDKKIVAKLFEHRIDEWVMREIQPAVEAYRTMLAENYDQALQNNLGVLYSRYGLFAEAEKEFKGLRKQGYIPAVVNTANIYFAKQSFNKALASYKAVLREDPLNDYAVLGIARSQWELGNYRESDKYYDQLKEMNPELASEYSYLSSFVETKGRAFNLADRLDTLPWDEQKTEAEKIEEEEVTEVETVDAEKIIQESQFNNEPDPEQELKPLDLTDANRFEMDYIREPEKRVAALEVKKEEEEEEEARLENEKDIPLEPEAKEIEKTAEVEIVLKEPDAEEKNDISVETEVALAEPETEEKTIDVPVETENALAESKVEVKESDISVKTEIAQTKVEPEAEEKIDVSSEKEVAQKEPEVEEKTTDVPVEKEVAQKEPEIETKIAELEPVTETKSLWEGDIPDFLFADIRNLEPDFLVQEDEEEPSDERTEVAKSEMSDSSTKKLAAASEENENLDSELEEETEESSLNLDFTLDDNTEVAVSETKKEEKTEEPVFFREIPRFTESPSAQWAPEEAFTIAAIPGMRSFDEEMGNTQNEKAFLFQEDELDDDNVENFDVFADTEETTVLIKEEKTEAVNPFGSFFDDPADLIPGETEVSSEELKAVADEKASAYKTPDSAVAENPVASVVETAVEASADKTVSAVNAVESVVEDSVKDIVSAVMNNEPVAETSVEKVSSETNKVESAAVPSVEKEASEEMNSENVEESAETSQVENSQTVQNEKTSEPVSETINKKKSPAGIIAGAVAALLLSAGAVLGIKKRKNRKPEEGK